MTDLAIAPDLSRLVVVGLECLPISNTKASTPQQDGQGGGLTPSQYPTANTKENRVIIYDYASRMQEAYVCLNLGGALFNVKCLYRYSVPFVWKASSRA